MADRKHYLIRVYHYEKVGVDNTDGRPVYERKLYDALTFASDIGMSSPIGDGEEWELYVEEVK